MLISEIRGTDRRRTLIVMLIYICQQVTGVQFVLGYSSYFFELAGIPTSQAFALNVGTLSLAVSGSPFHLSRWRTAPRP